MDKKIVTRELGLSDAIIQRVDNGWVLTSIDWLDDGGEGECIERTAVFEDPEIFSMDANPPAHSLSNLLWIAFDDQMQSKHSAGLVIEARQSRTREEMNEDMEEATTLEMKIDDIEAITDEARNITEGYNNNNLKTETDAI